MTVGPASAETVRGRARLCAGAVRTDLQQPEMIDLRDAAAAGADFHQLDDGNEERQPAAALEAPRARRLEPVDVTRAGRARCSTASRWCRPCRTRARARMSEAPCKERCRERARPRGPIRSPVSAPPRDAVLVMPPFDSMTCTCVAKAQSAAAGDRARRGNRARAAARRRCETVVEARSYSRISGATSLEIVQSTPGNSRSMSAFTACS